MRMTLEATGLLQTYRGTTCRVWAGTTEGGVPVFALVAAVAVRGDHDDAELRDRLIPVPAGSDDIGEALDRLARARGDSQ